MTGVTQRTISSAAVLERPAGSALQPLPLLGVLGEGLHAARDRVARRLVAGDHQQQEEQVELELVEHVPFVVRADELGDDVVVRARAALGASWLAYA